MAELEGNARRDVLQLGCRMREEGFAAGGLRDLLQNPLALDVERAARAATHFNNPDAVDMHIGLFEQLAQLTVAVARRVVLPIRDEQQRTPAVASLFDLLHSQISGVVKRCLSL